MRTRYGVSPWVHLFPDSRRPDFARARGSLTTDVVIVGAGLAGCAAAHACAAAGLKTVVLEANRVGQGGSGRSAGLLLSEPGPDFRDVTKAHGLRAARQVFESWRRASLDGAALLRRLHIQCGIESQEAVRAAWRDDERILRREHEARTDAGGDSAWLTEAQLLKAVPVDAPGGAKMRDAFALDPYRACVGLARAAVRGRARFFERSAVTKVTFNRKDVQVATADATVRANWLIVTTGLATPEFGALRRHFKRRETYLVLTEPVTAAIRKSILRPGITLAGTRAPRSRLRWTPDQRLLLGGGEQGETPERSRAAVRVQRTGQLMYDLLTMYPAISGLMPEYGWELTYGDTADGLPYIGPHRNFPHHLFALGGRGDSITSAFLAARVLLGAVQGTPDKADDLFSWLR